MVGGLEMTPGLYSHIAALVLGAALAGLGAWQVQALRYDARIADMQQAHAQASADAAQKAMDATIKMQRTKDDAIKAAEQRAKTQAANAAVLRTERDGLRAQLAATAVQLPSASCTSVRDYATTLTGLFDQCAGAYQDMAGKAAGHAADARLMLESWPK
jgi:ABC-type transporter Mla subunit MlaD